MDENEPAPRRNFFFFHWWKIVPGCLFKTNQARSSEIKRNQIFGTKSDVYEGSQACVVKLSTIAKL